MAGAVWGETSVGIGGCGREPAGLHTTECCIRLETLSLGLNSNGGDREQRLGKRRRAKAGSSLGWECGQEERGVRT